MGNPHPTNSKPAKIGRKHTGAPSTRKKAAMAKSKRVADQIKSGKIHRYKGDVKAFWRGDLDQFPEKPKHGGR